MFLSQSAVVTRGAYVSASDPGAVGVGKIWFDQTTSPPVIRKRNDANDGWDTVADLSGFSTSGDIDAAIAALVDSSPSTLDTLNELAAALGDDENFAATVAASLAGKAPLATVATQAASYVLVLADAGAWIRMDVASANTLTVPPNGTVAFPVNTEIHIEQQGAGQTTIVAGAGVTLNTSETLKLAKQFAVATLKKVGTDEWTLIGYLEAAP